MITSIVAVDKNGGFGKDGKIPWNFKVDFNHFKNTTAGAKCVMGKATYLDLLEMMKTRKIDVGDDVLKGRDTYVLSSTLEEAPGATIISSLDEMTGDYFVCGGEQLYKDTIDIVDKVYITVIDNDYSCDRFFPVETLDADFNITKGWKETEKETELMFVVYDRK